MQEHLRDDEHFRWGERSKTRVERISYQVMVQMFVTAESGETR